MSQSVSDYECISDFPQHQRNIDPFNNAIVYKAAVTAVKTTILKSKFAYVDLSHYSLVFHPILYGLVSMGLKVSLIGETATVPYTVLSLKCLCECFMQLLTLLCSLLALFLSQEPREGIRSFRTSHIWVVLPIP